MREGDEGVGQHLAYDLTAAQFVLRIEVAVEKQIATASTPASASACAACRTASSSSGVSTAPSWRMRSGTSSRQRRGTNGTGFSTCRSYRSGRIWRASSSRSRKPSVVIRPVRAPWRSSRALVATVVPCPRNAPRRKRRAGLLQDRRPPSTIASLGSRGVDVNLNTDSSPLSSTRQTSVKVPPVSTPTRTLISPLSRGCRACLCRCACARVCVCVRDPERERAPPIRPADRRRSDVA